MGEQLPFDRYLDTEVMKCDIKMVKQLNDDCRKIDKLNPNCKNECRFKMCNLELSSHANNPTVGNDILALKRNNIKCTPKNTN